MTANLLTIIIPVRREEESIGKSIRVLEKSVRTPHIILIADDTVDKSDRTIPMISKLSFDSRKAVRICRKKAGDKDGFGPALVRAIRKVRTPYTIFFMADMSDDPQMIDTMARLATKNSYDIVTGCRYMWGAQKIGGPMLQGRLSTILNMFLFYILRFPTRDGTNAFKLYNTAFLKSILPKHPETGVEFSLQLMARALSKHPKGIDVPTIWKGREKGQSKAKLLSRGPKYLKLVWGALTKTI